MDNEPVQRGQRIQLYGFDHRKVSSSCLSEHDFTIYSDLVSTAEDVEFENVNPVDALLVEGGVVEKYTGELTRDWWDVFVVKRVGQDIGSI